MAQRKRTDSYWIKRANQRLTRSERISKAHMRELAKVYNEARRQTVESLKQIYAAYYKGQDGFDMQALRSIVPSGELKRFLDDMKKLGISTDLPDNYNARITRLRFINEQLAAQAHKVAMSERTIDSKALREVYTDSYYRAGYDVARGIGSTPSGFSTLDQRTVDKVMNARFEGRNFSTRVWENSDILANKLKGELATAIATGQSIQKTAAKFRDDFNVNQYYAERLIRTETNHFHNSAELEAYKEMGFEKFKFLATLDSRTSEICQEMDGKIFNVKDGLPGENIPPLHPNCRSTIVPYFKGYEPETRLYRDPETGRNGYTYNVPYTDWKQTLPPVRRESPKTRSTGGETVKNNKTTNVRKKAVASSTKEKSISVYTGKLLHNDKRFRSVANDLLNDNRKMSKKFLSLVTGQEKRFEVATVSESQAKAMKRMFGVELKPGTKLYFSNNGIKHLLKHGHLTGVGDRDRNGRIFIDKRPLSVDDLNQVKHVFKTPDSVTVQPDNRIRFVKTVDNRHRLIVELNERGDGYSVITYFNENKRKLKK